MNRSKSLKHRQDCDAHDSNQKKNKKKKGKRYLAFWDICNRHYERF